MKSFLLIGDWGDFSFSFQEYLKKKDGYDEIFLIGDNFYPNGVEDENDKQWDTKMKTYFPISKMKRVVMGNHDYIGNVYCQIQYSINPFHDTWYLPHFFHDVYYKEESLHCFFIDTQLLAPFFTSNLLVACQASEERVQRFFALVNLYQEQQLTWLRNQLRTSRAKWKCIVGHYPILSGGPHVESHEMYSAIQPIIEKYNVQLYISGHDHNAQILSKGNCFYVVSGGSTTFIESKKKNTHVFQSKELGFMKLVAMRQKLELYFVSKEQEYLVYTVIKNDSNI